MQFKASCGRAAASIAFSPGKTSDPMIDMDDDITRRECSDLGQEILGAACLRRPPSSRSPKYILFGNAPRDFALKTLLDAMTARGRCLRQRQGLSGDDMGAALGARGRQAHGPRPFAGAVRPAGEDHPLAAGLQGCNLADGRGQRHWRRGRPARGQSCGRVLEPQSTIRPCSSRAARKALPETRLAASTRARHSDAVR